jgi:hypothetical protein
VSKAAVHLAISGKICDMFTIRRVAAVFTFASAFSLSSAAFGQTQSYQSNPYAGSGSGLSAGGLAPPGSGSGSSAGYDPQQSQTQATLQQADSKDSGRGLEFVWLKGEAGIQTLSLQTFHANNLVDAQTVATSQTGPVFGAAAGARLIFLTLGGNFRLGTFSAWQLWTLDAEVGLHLPFGKLEPYFTFAAGYASVGSFNGASSAIDYKGAGLNIHGWNARMGLGLDFYLSRFFSIGALMSGDVLYLKRTNHLTVPGAANDPNLAKAQQIYSNDGSSLGGAGTLTAVIGLHL